ncbi:MAG: prolipoprotein diacylglyceryl transferase [bacterium]|nr:prolipoprotein diacylglyceryl transferase [bacterium]
MTWTFPGWDPVLLDLPDWLPFDLRWYGLTYIIGFLCAQWILVRLARAGFLPVKPEVAPDIIFYCIIGVMLGGRTGYALFYDQSLLNPLEFAQVWKGGLAFHGGLTGVAIACWLFVRRHKIGWGRVADSCSLAVCPGIFAVRFANFINGELFGRKTTADTFGAMQFPSDIAARREFALPHVDMRTGELCQQVAFGHRTFDSVREQLPAKDLDGHTINWDLVAGRLDWEAVRTKVDAAGELVVPYRHPSQLYEGIGEGLLLGIVLLIVYRMTRNRPLAPGWYTAIFLLGYAGVRFSLETIRKPDAQFFADGGDGTVLFGMTMGQTLSALMVLGALLIFVWPKLRGQPAPGGDSGGSETS